MAIILDLPLGNSGVTVSYWRISTAVVYVDAACADVDLSGYLDLATREAGHTPLDVKKVRVNVAPDTASRATLYAAIKALPGFEAAIDEPAV